MDQASPDTPDMVTPFLQELSSTTRMRWGPSRSQWTEHRPTITDLYLTKGMTLKKVQDYMCTKYGFVASDKMYKNHITSWGLDKKFKKHEVLAMLAPKAHYKAQGITPTFEIRGRQIDETSLAQYIKRSHITIRDYCSISPLEAHQKAPELICHQSSQTIGRMTTSNHFKPSEAALHTLKMYVAGAFESSLLWAGEEGLFWRQDKGLLKFSHQFNNLMRLGVKHHRQNKMRAAWTSWRSAFLKLELVIHCHNPTTWLQLHITRLFCFWHGHLELAEMAGKHSLRLIEQLEGTSSPQRQFALALCHLTLSEMELMISSLCEIITTLLVSKLPLHCLYHEVTEMHDTVCCFGVDKFPLRSSIKRFFARQAQGEPYKSSHLFSRNLALFQFRAAMSRGQHEKEKLIRMQLFNVLAKSSPGSRKVKELSYLYEYMGWVYFDKEHWAQAKQCYLHALQLIRYYEPRHRKAIDSFLQEGILYGMDYISNQSPIADGDQTWRVEFDSVEQAREEGMVVALGKLDI